MIIAHQPGSEPITIPEQIPNPAVRPRVPKPAPIPEPRKPVKVPQRSRVLPLGLLLCALGGEVAAAQAQAAAWTTYRNERFGFSLSYPSHTFKETRTSQGGDGVLFVAPESGAKLLVGLFQNAQGYTVKSYQEYVARHSYGSYRLDYNKRGGTWFALSGEGHGTTFYEKVLFTCGGRWITSFAMLYPTAQRHTFDPIVERMEDSFAAGSKQCGPGEEAAATADPPVVRSPRKKETRRRGRYAAMADRIARSRGRNVVVIMRRTGPPYDYKVVRGYAAR
jgi:hypothetical protein